MSTDDQWAQRSADIAERLRTVIEAVDDLSFDLLRQAVRDGRGRPVADKKLLQIRRSLDKALHLLEGFEHRSEPELE
ncbi:MAG: hypothetical protein ACKOBT_05140 [Actinomycetota bacterium]